VHILNRMNLSHVVFQFTRLLKSSTILIAMRIQRVVEEVDANSSKEDLL